MRDAVANGAASGVDLRSALIEATKQAIGAPCRADAQQFADPLSETELPERKRQIPDALIAARFAGCQAETDGLFQTSLAGCARREVGHWPQWQSPPAWLDAKYISFVVCGH